MKIKLAPTEAPAKMHHLILETDGFGYLIFGDTPTNPSRQRSSDQLTLDI